MKVKCLLKREGGTKVDIEGVQYHFAPDKATGNHVAEVKDKKHLARFLSISEAYELDDGEDAPDLTDVKSDDLSNLKIKLLGSDWQPETVELGNGTTIATKLLVEAIFNVSGMTVEQWNAQSEEEVKALLVENVENFNDTPATPAAPAEQDDRNTLLAEAKSLKVKGAHLMGVEKLKEAIAAAKAE